MPGIVGLISKKPREVAERELAVMVESLRHENFYVTGTWINERLGIYAGWIARQDSFAAKMPVQNENGEITLIFSGEEFPEGGTEARLKNAGHQFASGTAEYLAHIFEEDSSFPASLNGRFQGLVVDQRSGSASLFNDRYGIHPVYIHECNDAFYFAGEAKAILAVRPQLRSLDPQGLGDFLACGAVLENRTLFEQIFKLPPASSWTFQNATLTEKRCYFDPSEWENQEPLESEAYYQELRRIFSQNLPRYFGGSERIGMSLTGGLDTRMVLAGRKIEPRSLPCYTFGSMFRDNHDVRTARQVAAACGQSFEVITAGREFLSNFAKYAERAVYLTDGAVDVSRSPDLYLNEHVRHVAPVRMTGEGLRRGWRGRADVSFTHLRSFGKSRIIAAPRPPAPA